MGSAAAGGAIIHLAATGGQPNKHYSSLLHSLPLLHNSLFPAYFLFVKRKYGHCTSHNCKHSLFTMETETGQTWFQPLLTIYVTVHGRSVIEKKPMHSS